MSHEASRERELHRYYQPWLETFHNTQPSTVSQIGRPRSDGHVPQSSSDKSLTAFAQLGTLRLAGSRCVVTLIDGKNQYILAEATKSLSLMDDSVHGPGDELWLGNAVIPRSQGLSEHALRPSEYSAESPDGATYRAPALVIPDVAAHDHFKSKSFSGAVSFYCGVPIVTKQGHPIGVYAVTAGAARSDLTAEELRFMVDMAQIVVRHLEVIKNARAKARGERLIQSIGDFLMDSDHTTGQQAEQHGPDANVHETEATEESKRPKSSRSGSVGGSFLGLTISDANALGRASYPTHDQQEAVARPISKAEDTPDDPSIFVSQRPISYSDKIVDRASRILRRSLGADGVLFVDATPANLSKATSNKPERRGGALPMRPGRDVDNAIIANHVTSITVDDQDNHLGNHEESHSSDSLASSGPAANPAGSSQACDVIGSCVVQSSEATTLRLSHKVLNKLVRRYPKGKCYHFDEDGRITSSDESSESALSMETVANEARATKLSARRHALLRLLPGARTVVFLPLWDYGRQRWHSAVILWSSHPARLMNIQEEFVYLKAFGNTMVNELARLSLMISDTAKATFLANISHELRSPLHGILGSIEFLHESSLDDFQSNMVLSVETCGKTLLDTVNHVLDFAKLSNLSKLGRRGISQATTSDSSLTSVFSLATIVEEAVEAVYAGQVFRIAHTDAVDGKRPQASSYGRAVHRRQDVRSQRALGQNVLSSKVRLTLNIENDTDWQVSSQPGAIRRIVMNLLGNSLKYSEKGYIDVSLEIDKSRRREDDSHLHACLTFCDTGRGMSEEFVRNHAFTAFRQEDSLTSGTGLGLSICRTIVDSLGGTIDMRSQQGVGTEIKVWLSLPAAPDHTSSSTMQQARRRLSGKTLCLLDPVDHVDESKPSIRKMPSVDSSLRHLATSWFSLNIISSPTVGGVDADFFLYAEPPPVDFLLHHHGNNADGSETPVIILCQTAFQANSLRADGVQKLANLGCVIEIISQPIGPHKLARVLQRCTQRAKNQDNALENGSEPDANRLGHKDDEGTANPSHIRKPQPDTNPSAGDQRSNETAQTLTVESLPLRPSIQVSTSALEPSDQTRSEEQSTARVLVVDDNEINLQLLIAFVRKANFDFEAASDGLMALEAYKRSSTSDTQRFRFVVMDISMPLMDGVTATREIRQFERENGIDPPAKIFALTGMGEQGSVREEAMEAGCSTFITKPIKFRSLRELLV